jgi:hypothetical protein
VATWLRAETASLGPPAYKNIAATPAISPITTAAILIFCNTVRFSPEG